MILKHLSSRLIPESSLRRHELVAKFSDSDNQVSSIAIQSWESNLMTENLPSNTILDNAQHLDSSTQSDISTPALTSDTTITDNSEPTVIDKITSFAEFQNANIQRLSEAIEGKTPIQALEYLENVIEGFSFEIWERKEKSFAAEILKNQIRKTVDAEKHKILPDYNPSNLSKTSRPKKVKTSSEVSSDKTIALFQKMGISESDAAEMIKKTISQTYEKGLSKLSIPSNLDKPTFRKCSKCSALNPVSMTECMICKTNLKECEYCSNVTKDKDSKTCSEHDKNGNTPVVKSEPEVKGE